MSYIKVPRSTYSKLWNNNNLSAIQYVSPPQQKPIYNPSVRKEAFGSFSLSAAVRYPYNECRSSGTHDCGNLDGVS